VIKNNFLIILTGLPASGKSLFANKLKFGLEKKNSNNKVEIIDPDIIRNKISPDEFNYKKEYIVRRKKLKQVRLALKKGYIVISDDLNYFTSMRHDLKRIAEDLGIIFFIIHITTPIGICLSWNEKRGNPIPSQVIENINTKFDKFGSYSWDIPIKTYDLSQVKNIDNEIEKLVDIIDKKSNISKITTKTKKDKKDVIDEYHHLLDRKTRSIIGKILQYPDYKGMKKDLLLQRKLFIKTKLNQPLCEKDISKVFIAFLEKNLNIEFSSKF